jgi:hypothetical protein
MGFSSPTQSPHGQAQTGRGVHDLMAAVCPVTDGGLPRLGCPAEMVTALALKGLSKDRHQQGPRQHHIRKQSMENIERQGNFIKVLHDQPSRMLELR